MYKMVKVTQFYGKILKDLDYVYLSRKLLSFIVRLYTVLCPVDTNYSYILMNDIMLTVISVVLLIPSALRPYANLHSTAVPFELHVLRIER